MKRMYENPKLKFMCVLGIDSVCNKCEHAGGREAVDCTPIALEWDKRAMAEFKAEGINLELGKIYTNEFITNLFKEELG